MKSLRSWFEKAFPAEPTIKQARAERREVPGLEAIHWTGSCPGLDIVRNISSTGMYLVTRERWQEGEINPIRLVYPELSDDSPDRQVTIQTKAVRRGEDGMGLSFILPECMDLWLWKSGGLIEPEDILTEFRVARSLAFLRRICPTATHELQLLFREGLSNLRIANIIAITNRAEIMLAAEASPDRLHAPENILLTIVKNGSWAEDPSTQQLWAGLLVTSCTLLGDDESNMPYLELVSEMASIDGRLFVEGCTKSEKLFAPNGAVSAKSLIRTSEELIQITGAHDLMKIDRNIFQLALLGLFEPRVKPKYFSYDGDANLSPTALGLELFARCQGHRGSPQDYYATQEREVAPTDNKDDRQAALPPGEQ
jgi:hypothetical protein